MIGHRTLVWAIGMISLATQACPAFDGKNSYIYESAEQEASSSHVLLGTIRAFHPTKGKSNQDDSKNRLYVAELEVVQVEKGSGVQPGDVVYVRFHTSIADEDLQYGTIAGGCYEINFKITPGHGHDARVYALLNDDYQYVADFPASFYRISLKHLKKKERMLDHPIPIAMASLFGSLAVVSGLVVAYAARGRKPRKRWADVTLIDPETREGEGVA